MGGKRLLVDFLVLAPVVRFVLVYIYIYSLVKNCYSFFYIFAWKPRNFEFIIILWEEVIFPFQGHSPLPWEISVF